MTVDLTLAKAQVRVTHSAEDALLTQYIASSKAWLERYTGLFIEEAEATDTFIEFGDYLQLTRGPFVSLTGVAYTDTAGVPQTFTDARYQDGRLYAPLTGWPSIETYSTIEVTYLAGYGDPYNPLPDELIAAQLLLIGHWYANREAVAEGTFNEVPLAVEALAGPFRLPTIA